MLLMTNSQIWTAFGLMGQFLLTARFVVQWLGSEREKKSIIPTAFWYFSIGGGHASGVCDPHTECCVHHWSGIRAVYLSSQPPVAPQ